MGIIDRFKTKKKKKKADSAKDGKQEQKAESQKTSLTEVPRVPTGGGSLSALVLKTPHVSEKATDLSNENVYVFSVSRRANKIAIKKAVEALYGVKVASVNVINVKGKSRRLGRTLGHTPAFKKAMVKLLPGQSIEVLPK
jgi:large subunit ribosomal protein L23